MWAGGSLAWMDDIGKGTMVWEEQAGKSQWASRAQGIVTPFFLS